MAKPKKPAPRAVRTDPVITFEPGKDYCRTDRGVFWGIKVTDTSDADFIAIFVRNGDSWSVGALLSGFEWEKEAAAYPNLRAYLREKLVPQINAWLREKFPPNGNPEDPPKFKTLAEELDWLIVHELNVTQNPDGTLSASLG